MLTLEVTQQPERVERGEKPANDGACACNGERGDTWRAVCTVVVSIDTHERRNEPGKATEPSWDEDTADQPDIIVSLAPPEEAHSNPTDGAATEANHQSIGWTPYVRIRNEE